MPGQSSPTVVLLSAPGTLRGIDARLRKERVRFARLPILDLVPIASQGWSRRLLRAPAPDLAIVSSRAAVRYGVVPWRRAHSAEAQAVRFWAVGPGTAAALRVAGVRRIRRPRTVGTRALLASIGADPPHRIVYFRSDVAGPTLARQLRNAGHQVTDLVAYRVTPGRPLRAIDRETLRRAKFVITTSPSSLDALRDRTEIRLFRRIRSRATLIVLGDQSRRAARTHGFEKILVAPSTTAQRFTRFLLQELHDASG